MLTTVRYILLTALRDWLFVGLFAFILAAFGVSIFLGGTSLIEEEHSTLAYISGSTRIILLIGLIIFVCFHIRRAFENKEIDVILSRPISRTTFVVAYWLGFSVVALLLVIPLSVIIGVFFSVDTIGLLHWSFSLALESLLIVALGLFSALILRSAVFSVLFCFGFYFMSRMMGFFLFILEKPYLFKSFDMGFITEKLLWLVSAILPRLDLFTKGEWLIYGVADTSIWIFTAQAFLYIPLLLVLAFYDFKRRQF